MLLRRVYECTITDGFDMFAQPCSLQIPGEEIRTTRLEDSTHAALLVAMYALDPFQVLEKVTDYIWQTLFSNVHEVITNDVFS
jgi:hypothetical protein